MYWDRAEDVGNTDLTKVLHEPTVSKAEYRVSGGVIKQVVNGIDECNISIGMKHKLYKKITPIRGIVKVINIFDGELEFYGRVLTAPTSMNSDGFSQEIICESMLGYLHDSVQDFEKIPNSGLEDYLTRIINRHNSQVEEHKKFKIGIVDVPAPSDTPFRYTGYDSSWDTIKERLIDKTSGYLVLRYESDGMYIDYLKSVGEIVNGSPIMLGANIKEATRDLNFDGLLTRIVPVGADIDTNTVNEGTSADIIRPQVTIKSVNGGLNYLESNALKNQFGVIAKSITWSNISDPNILKLRGQQYLDSMTAAVASWKVGVVDRYLIDNNYIKLKVGNIHKIINAPMSGIESLQIIEKNIDILRPQSVSLTIGSDNQTLSTFNLQQKEAQKSMEKVIADVEAKRLEQEKQLILAELKAQISMLMSEIASLQTLILSMTVDINARQKELEVLNSAEPRDESLISSKTSELNDLISQKTIFELDLQEKQRQLVELKKEAGI